MRFIEDRLSDGAARSIDLQGFRGALSSEAQLDRLTVADAEGIWLEIEGAVLNWSRAAVLRGRIQIDDLSAERVVLTRLPVTEEPAVSPEAQPFALPDLPVSIEIDLAQIARFELGEAVLGEALAASATTSITLSGGAGDASLEITRLDGPEGIISLSAGYDNASQIASIDLSATEEAGGLVVGLLDIPGDPSIGLQITGEGPVDNFAAEFALATDGQDRVTGTALSEPAENGAVAYSFGVSGDLTPVISGDLETFLGRNAEVSARALVEASGAVELEDLSVQSAALDLQGALRLDANRAPERFTLAGTLSPPGADERLALPGGTAEIDGAELELNYNRAEGDRVAGSASLSGLHVAGFTAPTTQVALDGRITSGSFAGAVDLLASGLDHTDPAIAEALGTEVEFNADVAWGAETGLTIEEMALITSSAQLTGDISAVPGVERVDVAAELALDAADLSPFGALAGQPIGGAAELTLALQGEALSGMFETEIAGLAADLRAPDLVPDGLLRGETRLSGGLSRDGSGIALSAFELEGTELSLSADGSLATNTADLEFDVSFSDAELIDARLDGSIAVTGHITRVGASAPYQLPDLLISTSYGTVQGDFTALPGDINFPVTARVVANLPDLSRLSELAGMPLGGAAELAVTASGDLRAQTLTSEIVATTVDLRAAGLPSTLLAGELALETALDLSVDTLRIEHLSVEGREITASASGLIAAENSAARLTARLRDASLLVSALPGAVSVEAEITQSGAGPISVTANATGPAGLQATARGDVTPELDLSIDGTAPLALANPFIAPQTLSGRSRFNLTVIGPPEIASLGGQASVSGARLGIPAQSLALENIAATANVANGGANLDLTARLSTGGQLGVTGRVGIAQPGLPANISISLDQGRLVDPSLYEAAIDSLRLTLDGALAGSAFLAGEVNLGVVELRVPESSVGSAGAIPDIRHVGESGEERRTRAYAGLFDGAAGGGGSSAVGLDVSISAPGRIFLRGRGLDAELGGTLRIGGTSANPVPSGRFDLIRGRLSILGQRLDLTEGSATLPGGAPYLELSAETRSGEYTIFVDIEGPATAPVVSFRSAPELPEDEVLAQLFFGRSVSSLSAVQALQLADGVAGLAGGGSGIFTRLREGLGLDDLDIQTDAEGNAIVSAGRYLSDNIYTDVTVDNDGTGVTLNIDLTPSITARGGVASDGESAIGIFFERDY